MGDFLASPALNRHEKLSEVFAVLASGRDVPEHAAWERHRFFSEIFPGEPYDDKKLRYVLSDLSKALEDFMVWSAFKQEPFEHDRLLLKSYRQRNLDKFVLSALGNMEKRMKDHPYRDATYQGMRFLTEEARFQFNSSRKSHQTETNLQQVVDSLDVYYLSNKLRYSCEILNNKGVVNVDYELFLLEEIQQYLRHRNLDRYPVIAIYHQILLTLREPDDVAHYHGLLQLLEQDRHLFGPQEVFDMYVYAKNYCIIKINKGNVGFTQELFEFYKVMLKNGILFKDGHLTQWDFKNLVSLGLRLDEYTWTKKFMEDYRQYLQDHVRENVWSFNMANLEFHLGHYDNTLSLLQEVEFTDPYYHLDSKALLLKTYYHTSEWDSLLSLIDAFKVYLKRNRHISVYQRTVYGNLVRFVGALLRFKRGRKVNLEQLAAEVEECREIANIVWLKTVIERERTLEKST